MRSRRGRGVAITLLALAVVGALVMGLLGMNDRGDSTAAGSTDDSSSFGAVGSTETVPCPDSLVTGAAFVAAGNEVEGKTYECGVVVVPENHDKPDGRTLELFYLKLKSRNQTPAPDPLVYLSGGPGSSGSYELTANPLLNQNLDRIRQDRDIIAYDQRGTGFSGYLPCAPFEATLGILQDRDTNPQIAATIKDLQTREGGLGYGALRQNLCGVSTRLLAGTDLTQYNSVASAQDLPQLVAALGYRAGYTLYGTSYGTKLAQVAMRTVPDGIRGVVLDGAGGPSIPNMMWSSTKHASPYVEVIAQCQADAACAAAYPDLAARFDRLLTKLAKQPLVLDPPMKVWSPLTVVFPKELKQIDAQFFIDLAKLDNLAMGGGFAGQVPRMIKAAEEGDVKWFQASKLNDANSAATTPPATVPADSTGGGGKPLFKADQPLFEQPLNTLLQVATAAAANAKHEGPDSLWVTVALGDLAVRLQKGENQADLMEALLRLSVLPNGGSSAQQLRDYADANLSPESAKTAKAIVGKMNRNDVRATMWNLQDVAMALGAPADTRSYSYGMQYAFNCADELAFTSTDEAKAELARTRYPQLAAFPVATNEQFFLGCLSYPSALDRGFTQPVRSDIPTLVYVSALDNETPAPWGRTVAKGLAGSTVVEWGNQGHVVAAHDPKLCAGNVAAGFLRDPSSTPDLACTRAPDYQLTFALR